MNFKNFINFELNRCHQNRSSCSSSRFRGISHFNLVKLINCRKLMNNTRLGYVAIHLIGNLMLVCLIYACLLKKKKKNGKDGTIIERI